MSLFDWLTGKPDKLPTYSSPSVRTDYSPTSARDLLDTSTDLYNRAVESFRPPSYLTDYTNQMLNRDYNTGYNTGLAGSSIQAANEASGITSEYDKSLNQYLNNLYQPAMSMSNTQRAYDQMNQRGDITNAQLQSQTNQLNRGIQAQNQAMDAAYSPWSMIGSGIGAISAFM